MLRDNDNTATTNPWCPRPRTDLKPRAIHVDSDTDGRIGREEFIGVMKSSVTAPENFEDAVIRIADAFMRIVDTTGDGSLDFDEYVRMYDGLGIDPTHSCDAFRRLDRDGNGKISHEEFRAAITEFYLSDDENAPGNWLLPELFNDETPTSHR
ncbi:MAG: EF-hand domain-containing protein [Pseudonocardiaceae bacterium]